MDWERIFIETRKGTKVFIIVPESNEKRGGKEGGKSVKGEKEVDRYPSLLRNVLRMSCSLLSNSAVGGRCAESLWRHCLINTTTEGFPFK